MKITVFRGIICCGKRDIMKKTDDKSFIGGAAVALAYVMWGLLTIFWNLLSDVNPVYILAQRIIWSMIVIGVYIIISGRLDEIKCVFRSRKDLLICFVCGILITINWGVYIYAVNSSHVLDASLGYFIEPVLVGTIGLLIFKEKPGTFEKVTYILAFAALLFIIIRVGTFPSLSLIIAGSFAIYGAVKKNLKISAEASLFMETLFMTPIAIAYVVIAEKNGTGAIGVLDGWRLALLPVCGIVTSLPLLLFNRGVKEIPYYISGIFMYINPTIAFLMGLFYFHEELDKNRLIAFIIIWIGVAFAVFEKIRQIKGKKA